MAESSASQKLEVLSTKQFREKLQNLVVLHNQLIKIAKNSNDEVKEQIPDLNGRYKSMVHDLEKHFVLARNHKTKRTKANRKEGTGFYAPKFVSDNIRKFFKEADLGLLDPRFKQNEAIQALNDKDGTELLPALPDLKNMPLRNAIQFMLESGICATGTLTPLFAIYADLKRLTYNAKCNRGKDEISMDRQRLGGDKLFKDCFASTIKTLIQRGSYKTKRGTLVPVFDADDFPFIAFQKIISLNVRTHDGLLKDGSVNPAGAKLTDKEKATLLDPKVIERVRVEQALVSRAKKVYKEMDSENKKSFQKKKREAKRNATKKTA
jgi:hypothetical protein